MSPPSPAAQPAPLQFLVFDVSEGTDGVHTFDALASVQADQRMALAAEAEVVRRWCRMAFAQGPGPLEDGHPWDEDLHWQTEGAWHTLSLSVTGTDAFAQAFMDAWLHSE
ncbi:hypothetical protein WNB94_08380 [Aquabacterium sp. A3]|uniref:hypothetical protein n=1 Tax=Aquabacterium sp. A3 TaxID=3132829 RepID=UPI00311A3B09